MQTTSEQLIKSLSGQLEQLIRDNWIELWSYRNYDQAVGGSIGFRIKPEGTDFAISTAIRYGIRLQKKSGGKVLMKDDNDKSQHTRAFKSAPLVQPVQLEA